MSRLNKVDVEVHEEEELHSLECDRFYGWEIDVSDTWYINMPNRLSKRDCLFHTPT